MCICREDEMKKVKFYFCIIIALFISCATTQLGVKKEHLSYETIERNVEIKTVIYPKIDIPPGEEITAHTNVEPNFVVEVVENVRKRHHYNKITSYERRVLGFFPPKEFKKTEKKFDDDKSYSSSPLANLLLKVDIIASPYTLSLSTDTAGIVRIPVDSIIKLCSEKSNIAISITSTNEPSLKQQLTITSSFIASFRKLEELRNLEQIRLAKLEKERKKIEVKVVKIINKVWRNRDKVSTETSISYGADSTVHIRFTQSKSERTACIKAGKIWGVSGALGLFETSAWNQFIVIAPALFKKSYVKAIELTMDVEFEAIINPRYTCEFSAVFIKMNRTTANKVDWVRDVMKKDPENLANVFSIDQMFRIFLLDGFERGAFYQDWQ